MIQISVCQEIKEQRETVLDNISHTEDSIYYHIDSLPRLCDELGIKRQFIDIGDCKLYCETEGQGIPMIVINGGPGGTHHYFHPWFSMAKDYCKIIYYDQRGCGKSDFVKGDGYSFRQAIDDLDKLRQKLGIKKWIVCGYSYGGAVAQFYTAVYPESVLGMVLISSAPMLQKDVLNNTRQNSYISKDEEKRIRSIYQLYNDGKINLTQLLYNKDLNGDWKRQNYYKPTKAESIRSALYEWINDNDFNQRVGNSFCRYDFKNIFEGCPVPTLVCEAKWDLTWTEDKIRLLKENLPHAEFALFEKSGHPIFHDEPELFFSRLKRYIRSLKPISQKEIKTWKIYTNTMLAHQEEAFRNEDNFFKFIDKDGVESAEEYYKSFKLKNKDKQLFSESRMNNLGYSYLSKKDYRTAIQILKLNAEAYPDSWNVYDSLGDAYLTVGNKEKGIENYRKSVELNSQNENGKKILKEIVLTQ